MGNNDNVMKSREEEMLKLVALAKPKNTSLILTIKSTCAFAKKVPRCSLYNGNEPNFQQ